MQPMYYSVDEMNGANSNDWSEDKVIRCSFVDDILRTNREKTKLTRGRKHTAKIQDGDELKESVLH